MDSLTPALAGLALGGQMAEVKFSSSTLRPSVLTAFVGWCVISQPIIGAVDRLRRLRGW
jgi:hypothetical protein